MGDKNSQLVLFLGLLSLHTVQELHFWSKNHSSKNVDLSFWTQLTKCIYFWNGKKWRNFEFSSRNWLKIAFSIFNIWGKSRFFVWKFIYLILLWMKYLRRSSSFLWKSFLDQNDFFGKILFWIIYFGSNFIFGSKSNIWIKLHFFCSKSIFGSKSVFWIIIHFSIYIHFFVKLHFWIKTHLWIQLHFWIKIEFLDKN